MLMVIFTSLSNVHDTRVVVDRDCEHVPGEEFGLPGPARIQLVQRFAQQLKVLPDAVAAEQLGAVGAIQHHRQHYDRGRPES